MFLFGKIKVTTPTSVPQSKSEKLFHEIQILGDQ